MNDDERYVQGFLIPVPTANREAYLAQAKAARPIFEEYGALRIVECWGDSLPDGEVTDFRRAVEAEEGESVVFSWIEWPSKAHYEKAGERMQSDPRWQAMGDMPFDGKRMFWGGFEILLDSGA